MRILEVKVKPNANQQKIERTEDGVWLVSLRSPPIDGKANKELIKLLAKTWVCPKSKIQIKSGLSTRNKLIQVDDGIDSFHGST